MGLWLGLAAAAAYAVPALAAASLQASSARAALWLAWVLHGSALAWAMLEPTPRFGFASALSVTAWLVLTVYAIERQLFPQLQTRWALAALGSVAVLLALVFRVYRAECVLGFVLGMTFTFGAILPALVASVTAVISAVAHRVLYPLARRVWMALGLG